MNNDLLVQTWVDFLSNWSWVWFGTMTFRGSVGYEQANKKWSKFICQINRWRFGPKWYKKPCRIGWVRSIEYQKRGILHFHCLFDNNIIGLKRLDLMDFWFDIAGICRIEPIKSEACVITYVSKYVLKQGEIDFYPEAQQVLLKKSGRLLGVFDDRDRGAGGPNIPGPGKFKF